MDKRTDIRNKVNTIVTASSSRQREGWREEISRRAGDLWERFLTFSLIEKAMVIGGIVLVLVLPPVGVRALVSGGGGGGHAAIVSQATPTQAAIASYPTATTAVVATIAVPTAKPAATPAAGNRGECDEIRGTAYRSDSEREWFQENCAPENEPAPIETSPDEGDPPTEPPEPTPTSPPPPVGFTADDAISSAIPFIQAASGSGSTISASLCSAVPVNGKWVVTCTILPPGCPNSSCGETYSACVFESPRRVVPTTQC